MPSEPTLDTRPVRNHCQSNSLQSQARNTKMSKLKKFSIILLVIVCIAVVYWGGVILFRGHIFLTPAGADGEPHKFNFIVNLWLGLSFMGVVISQLVMKAKKL